MHIGITGATGLLGSAIVQKIDTYAGWSAFALDRKTLQNDPAPHLREMKEKHNLDCVIHCAANTNVDACEKEPHISLKDNFKFSRDIARACAAIGVKFVYISSTGVYGADSAAPYRENDPPCPTTVHHKHKLLAEHAAQETDAKALVIRTGWLFGGDVANPKNFVANRLREIFGCSGEMKSDVSQIGNPTFVDDLADHVLTLITLGESGVFNCVSPEPASRFEYVQQIVKASGRDVHLVPVNGRQFKRVAKTSPNESAYNQRLSSKGLDNMPPWKQRLAEYVPSILDRVKHET